MKQVHTNINAIQVASPKELAMIISTATTSKESMQLKREDCQKIVRQRRKVRAYELPLL